jgi:adenine phosphoribosyltransferase
MDLTDFIRDVPDFPKKGIVFKDITTLLKDKGAFKHTVDLMTEKYRNKNIDKVVGIESRGFIFAGVVAYQLGCGLVLTRKPGKLPSDTISEEYELEYGTDLLEVHTDAIKKGDRVVIVDDLLATGGTARAVAELIERLEGVIEGMEFLIELLFLRGRSKVGKYNIHSYIQYE